MKVCKIAGIIAIVSWLLLGLMALVSQEIGAIVTYLCFTTLSSTVVWIINSP